MYLVCIFIVTHIKKYPLYWQFVYFWGLQYCLTVAIPCLILRQLTICFHIRIACVKRSISLINQLDQWNKLWCTWWLQSHPIRIVNAPEHKILANTKFWWKLMKFHWWILSILPVYYNGFLNYEAVISFIVIASSHWFDINWYLYQMV